MFAVLYVITLIKFCTGEVQVGTLNKDTYRDAEVIVAYDKIGLKMCGRQCRYQSSCSGINYNTETLVCELLKTGGTSSTRAGHLYSSVGTWTMEDDPCNPNPCSDTDKCVKTASGGHYCQSVFQPCNDVVCQHGGTCKNGVSSFECQCTTGISGQYCEITPCTSEPCQNSGTCSFSGSSFSCACTLGYYGTQCESHACSPNPCQNSGTCTPTGGSGNNCACTTGWYGSTCTVSPCLPNPCQNGGVCTATGSSAFTCACPSGWFGSTCNADPCSPNPCLNGGTCTGTGVSSFNCACVTNYMGSTCEQNIYSCSGRCGEYTTGNPCQCDSSCSGIGDCCSDHGSVCPG